MRPKTEPWGTPQDESNMKEEKVLEVTEKDLLGENLIGFKPVVRGTHDAKTGSETIEENGVVNCVTLCQMQYWGRDREEWRAHYQLHGPW